MNPLVERLVAALREFAPRLTDDAVADRALRGRASYPIASTKW
ncbi:hypothetical protein [Frigoriglobus tundricola]|uniref:Uncharacterized protein n=1 Tax=Frigoriglobus tundricola TaxID=2774151 RepID=A0A6M5YPV8_9BACT|nr:hypothetical protein [Frigoriglobus tundricola]QJW95386.1 hypothetical protein FTUN_2935 [Frigoriglobus tundricola]